MEKRKEGKKDGRKEGRKDGRKEGRKEGGGRTVAVRKVGERRELVYFFVLIKSSIKTFTNGSRRLP